MLAAFALWAGAHLFDGGDIGAILFFGGFWVLSTFGMVHIDARRRANANEAWWAFEDGTCRTQFKAIPQDRRSLVMRDVGWWRVVLATVLYLALLYVHENIFGMNLFPV